jgi:hypothetical protein
VLLLLKYDITIGAQVGLSQMGLEQSGADATKNGKSFLHTHTFKVDNKNIIVR